MEKERGVSHLIFCSDKSDYPNACLRNGRDYRLAYNKLKSLYDTAFKELQKPKIQENYNKDDPEDLSLAGPMVVSLALSIELTLKSLLKYQKHKFNNIHKIKDLFHLLDDCSQQCIRADIESRYDSEFAKEVNFENELESHNNIFVRLRYGHEKESTSINIMFLEKFSDALLNYILK